MKYALLILLRVVSKFLRNTSYELDPACFIVRASQSLFGTRSVNVWASWSDILDMNGAAERFGACPCVFSVFVSSCRAVQVNSSKAATFICMLVPNVKPLYDISSVLKLYRNRHGKFGRLDRFR